MKLCETIWRFETFIGREVYFGLNYLEFWEKDLEVRLFCVQARRVSGR